HKGFFKVSPADLSREILARLLPRPHGACAAVPVASAHAAPNAAAAALAAAAAARAPHSAPATPRAAQGEDHGEHEAYDLAHGCIVPSRLEPRLPVGWQCRGHLPEVVARAEQHAFVREDRPGDLLSALLAEVSGLAA